MVLMSPLQCLLFFAVAIWSGQVSCTLLYNVPPSVFWNSVHTWMEASDLPSMLIKAVVFGGIVSLVSTYAGFSVNRASTEIPQAGIKAVGKCFIWCIAADGLISLLYYLLK